MKGWGGQSHPGGSGPRCWDSRRCLQRDENQAQRAHAWGGAGVHRDRRTWLNPAGHRPCAMVGCRNPYLSWGLTSWVGEAGRRPPDRAGQAEARMQVTSREARQALYWRICHDTQTHTGHARARPGTSPGPRTAGQGVHSQGQRETLSVTHGAISPSSAASGSPRRRASPRGIQGRGGRGRLPKARPGRAAPSCLPSPSCQLGCEPQVTRTGAGTPGLGWVDGTHCGVWVFICHSPSSQGAPAGREWEKGARLPRAGPLRVPERDAAGRRGGCGLGSGSQEEGRASRRGRGPSRGEGLWSSLPAGSGTRDGRGTQASTSRARTMPLGRAEPGSRQLLAGAVLVEPDVEEEVAVWGKRSARGRPPGPMAAPERGRVGRSPRGPESPGDPGPTGREGGEDPRPVRDPQGFSALLPQASPCCASALSGKELTAPPSLGCLGSASWECLGPRAHAHWWRRREDRAS